MKMSLLVSVWILAGTFTGFGQGTVNFNNTPSTFGNDGVDRFVYDVDGVTRLTGQNYAAALYFGTSESSITTLAVLNATDTSLNSAKALFRAPTTTLPGTWVGGSRTLLGTTPGQTVFMQVRIWDISLFASYDVAKHAGGIIGQSEAFTYRISTSPTPAPSELVMANLRFMVPIPEPTTLPLLLGALGGLLGFRCRKRWFG